MPAPINATLKPLRVLVVDDHPRIRDPLAQYLQRQGMRVRTAGDISTTRLLLAHESFDVIVLDVMLPDGNGVQLCQELRPSSPTPVILLTARDAIEDRVLGLESGADDYLVKPFDPRELLARISSVHRRASANTHLNTQASAARHATSAPETPLSTQPVSSQAHAQRPSSAQAAQWFFDGWHFDPALGRLQRMGAAVDHPQTSLLTSAQARLLEVFLAHANHTLSRDELLELTNTNGRDGELAFDRSMDRQISRLRSKLQTADGSPLRTVRSSGYRLVVHAFEAARA